MLQNNCFTTHFSQSVERPP